MADDQVKVEIIVTENATKTIPQVNRALSGMQNELRGTSRALAQVVPGMNAFNSALSYGLVGGTILAAEQMAKFVANMGESGAQLDRLSLAFNNLWEEAGGGEATLARLRKASRGTIDDFSLMVQANRALMSGVSQDADALASLLEVAAFRGRALAVSTQEAYSRIVLGISRMSPLILDDLAIYGSQRALDDYARSVGKTANELSDLEKRTILTNHIIREGNKLMDDAGGLTDDAATNYERLATAATNFKNALSQGVSEGLEPTAKAIADTTEGSENFGQSLGRLVSNLPVIQAIRLAFEAMGNDLDKIGQKQYLPLPIAGINSVVTHEAEANKMREIMAHQRQIAGQARIINDYTRDWAIGLADVYYYTRHIGPNMEELLGTLQGDISGAITELADAVAAGDLDEAVARQLLEGFRQGAEILAQEGLTEFGAALGRAELWQKMMDKVDASREARAAGKAAGEAFRNSMQSAIQSVTQPTFEGDPTNILDRMGLHIDTADEDARRLASVMAEGLHSQWTQYFADKGLLKPEDLISDQAVVAASANILREFQLGLRPELIDKETAKQRVREILVGQYRMEQLANEVMQELQAEGINVNLSSVTTVLGQAKFADPLAKAAASDLVKNGQVIDAAAKDYALRFSSGFMTNLFADQSFAAGLFRIVMTNLNAALEVTP